MASHDLRYLRATPDVYQDGQHTNSLELLVPDGRKALTSEKSQTLKVLDKMELLQEESKQLLDGGDIVSTISRLLHNAMVNVLLLATIVIGSCC